MYKFGFNINWKNTPEEILELGRTCLGTGLYGAVEVTYYENMEGTDTFRYNQAIRQLVESWHPQVVVHLPALNLSEENNVLRSAILHEIENCCKYATELGGREVVIHGGYLTSGIHVPVITRGGADAAAAGDGSSSACVSREETGRYRRAWELTVRLMRQACRIAAQYGVTIYTENLNNNHLTTECAALNRLLDDVGEENLKIVFDIGHCHHTGHDVAADVLEAGGRLKHLHLHDNWGEKDEHLPIGEGDIDYEAFALALHTVGYQGLYMMELFHCDTQNLTASRERLLKCLD